MRREVSQPQPCVPLIKEVGSVLMVHRCSGRFKLANSANHGFVAIWPTKTLKDCVLELLSQLNAARAD